MRFLNTKKARNGNSRYVRCKLEDFTGSVECVMWPDDFLRHKDEFQEDRVCFVKGTVERTREEPGLVLSRVLSVQQAKQELTKWLKLSLIWGCARCGSRRAVGPHSPAELLAPVPSIWTFAIPSGRRCRLKAGESYRVNPSPVLTGELEMVLGPGSGSVPRTCQRPQLVSLTRPLSFSGSP